ncbi:S-adenosylmethionine:tRNA ribosyltransferase-isomerase [Bradyrhizobium sp. USDA 4523]
MRTDLFDFELPPESIALRPANPRDAARMLVVHPDGVLRDAAIADLPQWLEPGDQIVVNDTKVIAAQLKGRRIGRDTEPKIEATLIKRLDGSRWQALVKPAKKLSPGDTIRFGNEGRVCLLGNLDAEVEAKGQEGEVTLSFSFHGPVLDQAIADVGATPLPPYIASKRTPDEKDVSDYQTMFAANEGAVAAPTAGLHFTPALEAALKSRGVELHRLTLHVGAGTFLPVKTEETSEHKMHAEWGCITAETASALNAARAKGGRIVAIGTTSLRPVGKRRQCRRHHRAVCGGNLDLHHAGLPLPRGRYFADQLPSAALDAVHAGLGLLRPRDDAGRLRACDQGRLPVLFVWRCVFAVSRARLAPQARLLHRHPEAAASSAALEGRRPDWGRCILRDARRADSSSDNGCAIARG